MSLRTDATHTTETTIRDTNNIYNNDGINNESLSLKLNQLVFVLVGGKSEIKRD